MLAREREYACLAWPLVTCRYEWHRRMRAYFAERYVISSYGLRGPADLSAARLQQAGEPPLNLFAMQEEDSGG